MRFWPFLRRQVKPDWVLYTAPECHLCDEAQALLRRRRLLRRVRIVEITGSLELLRRYRRRIPVLATGDTELDWPFDATHLETLARRKHESAPSF